MRPRSVHPLAWWIWGLLLGAAAIRTTNPLLVGLLIAATWLVVASRRRDVPWARSFSRFLKLGVLVLVVRLVLQAFFAPRIPGQVLVRVPEFDLPAWAAGVRVGGAVTLEGLLQACYDTLPLLGLLAAVGAANSLADPHRLLRALPAALYEAAVAITVSLSLVSQAGVSAAQVREARRLRGRPTSGLAAVRGVALPVLQGALERSVWTAASMDARGFGRRALVDPRRHTLTRVAGAAGLVTLAVGTYAILDSASPAGLGAPALAAGVLLLVTAMVLGGARSTRTRYRPDPWSFPEWATVGSGAAVFAGFLLAGRLGIDLTVSVHPIEFPVLPILPGVAVLLAALPALATPEPAR